jgi:hypothetical protein
MADNTLQYEWIVTLKGNLDELLEDDFVAGNILWYPVEGQPKTRIGPDVLIALGRPKGYRGSYKTWCEDGVVPQVVFEVLSPGNRPAEMARKRDFYERHGVHEYYVLDPDAPRWEGHVRHGDALLPVAAMHGFVSPLLAIRFALEDGQAKVFGPDGTRFPTWLQHAAARAESDRRVAEQARTIEAQAAELEALRRLLAEARDTG